MKIIQFSAENVKRLRAVSITPDGAVVRIVGRNAQGKSSILDSILYAIGGGRTHPEEPIRKGEKKGTVRLDLGDLVVTRTFTPGGSQVVVAAKDGAQYPKAQAILDRLYGTLTFDPLAFTRMGPKEQLDALRALVPLEIDVDALDRANKTDYENRTETNRHLKSAEHRLAQLDAAIDGEMITTPIDVNALLELMASASEHNAGLERKRTDRAGQQRAIEQTRNAASAKRADAAQLLAEAEALEEKCERWELELTTAPKLPDPIDVQDLRAQIAAAQQENDVRAAEERRRQERHAAANEVMRYLAESQKYTDAMKARDEKKAAAIAAAKMPIDGLSFGDGYVVYDGVPFDQASSAQQLRVSFAIAMAANPKLRVALVRDGSLLDEDSMKEVARLAEAHDFQVWIEAVGSDAPAGILIEDGSVVAVNGQAVEPERSEAEATEPALAGD